MLKLALFTCGKEPETELPLTSDFGLSPRDTGHVPMDLPYYHSPLSKTDCESLLLSEGVDGKFLLRDSESVPGALCLCVSFKRFVYTYRIFKEKHGCYSIQTVEGTPKLVFPNLKELIATFEKPGQGLVVPLLKAVERSRPCLRWRRSTIQLDGTYENYNSDYVQVLP